MKPLGIERVQFQKSCLNRKAGLLVIRRLIRRILNFVALPPLITRCSGRSAAR